MTGGRQFGPRIGSDGVTFRHWAPAARSVSLVSEGAHPMLPVGDGWFETTQPDASAGARYKFRINDEIDVPDPASRFQPEDVHGPSEAIGPAFGWACADWKGRPWHECVFLELHIGSFAPQGTFLAAIDKLDHVAQTGFTAIELMPVADFAGRWNWGYDGVLPFAPDSIYGRPEDLKALIDAAHARGLMVFLDVVYNHFGPEGNYLGRYAPSFFTDAHTPWGNAIDYRVPQVRAFAIENALHWLDDYRFDGLRLDAVHAIAEPGSPSVLEELSKAVGHLAASTGRYIHLVLENDDNRASLLDPRSDPPRGHYRAQWNDDYHHAFHVLLTGETTGYYCDYRDANSLLARTLGQGFAYQGEPSPHRGGSTRGEPSRMLPATAFVNFLQNHDQIGNRALGERLAEIAQPEALEAALAVTLLAPAPPLMFMGDEWGSKQPFPFFCDFKGELADAVRQGRRKEFAEAYAKHSDEIPDPLASSTVELATLDWSARARGEHRARLDLVRHLLATRRASIMPLLSELEPGASEASVNGGVLDAHWRLNDGRRLRLVANLANQPLPLPRIQPHALIWGDTTGDLAAWAVVVVLESE
ncbi:MAG TPA: malto-oligosyltrehalose trehalohydrolase [Bradyrhizobium sp.]|nr:malto-oligosyltrehalose trehalohydrolase [Bradyrhizobium sp.]